MNIIYTDALIIGGGLAGMRTAIGLKRRGFEPLVLSLVPPKRSHSAAAQGGMQASLGNSVKGLGDNEDIHFADTVRGSDWGADQQVVRMFVETAPKAVRELAAWGVPWNRVQKGKHQSVIDGQSTTLEESDDAHGLITARNFGGTQKWRTCYVSDGTGHSMLYNLSNQAIAEKIPVHERREALSLIHDGQRCYGAIVRNLMDGSLSAYVSKATCIATGGFGRIYKNTTNAVINEGIGAAIALETGVAQLGNMEAVQFHPTAIFPAGILVTEGCRGDGGLLLDKNEHRFMPDYEPNKKELASRDVVARWMETHIRNGHGVNSRFGEHLWLDIRLLGQKHIDSRLREVKEICHYFLGIDPVKQLIPVRPAQHYSMGGIRTDYTGQSPTLLGLFSAGEAACWDMHGFNRLGGNSVAETVVAGMIVGEYMADAIDDLDVKLSTGLVKDALNQQAQSLNSIQNSKDGKHSPFILLDQMQTLMSNHVGIFRDREHLQHARDALLDIQNKAVHLAIKSTAKGANPELICAYRLQKMIKLALCVTQGALQREESRGAHFREDFPLRNDKDWLKRTLATWNKTNQSVELSYEDLDVNTMELAPGWRGYGSKDRVDHPNTEQRAKELENIQNEDFKGLPKLQQQEKIMAFRHLLPEGLQGRNMRWNDGGAQ